MLNSTEKQPKTLQNQSNLQLEHFTKFYDTFDFAEAPVNPYGSLWTDYPDSNTAWVHTHNFLEIGRCVKGSGIFNVDGKVLRVKAPCYTIVYEGEWHSAQSNPYDKSEWNYLYVDLNSFLANVNSQFSESLKGLNWRNYDFPNVMSAESYPKIAHIIDAIFEESSEAGENSVEALTGLVIALLSRHARLFTKSGRTTTDTRTVVRIAPALSYINSHYAENITVQQLADLCYISTATLRRCFREFSGESPADYLHKTRIKNAAVMLITTQKSVLEIAMDTGYPTASCFDRQFFMQYRISPREYRKRHSARKKQ